MKPYHRPQGGDKGEGGFVGSNAADTRTPPPETRAYGQAPEPFEPEIPELKKQEKERKGAGVPFYGGGGAGSSGMSLGSMAGSAQVGSSLSGGFLGSGRIAMALSNFFGGPGTFLGGLFASSFGSTLVAGGILSWVGLLGVAGLALMNRAKPQAAGLSAPVFPTLGSMSSSGIVIDAPKNRSLDYLGKANSGELAFDEAHPLAPKDAPKEEKKEEPKGEAKPETPTPQFQMPNMNDLAKKGLSPEGFAKKLSDGSGFSGGGAGLGGPKLAGGNFDLKKTFSPNGVGTRNKLAPLKKRKMNPLVGSKVNRSQVNSKDAMSQLRVARSLSGAAYGATDAPAKQTATDAFEQGKTKGGAGIDNLGMTDPGGDAVVPPSGLGDYSIPEVSGTNVTPYQSDVDSARQMGNNAGMLKAMGLMLIIMGIGLIITGIGLLNCTTFPIGLALIGAGMALMMVGFMLLAMGAMQANNAKNKADKVGGADKQKCQQTVAKRCIDHAYAVGKKVDEVCPQLPDGTQQEPDDGCP